MTNRLGRLLLVTLEAARRHEEALRRRHRSVDSEHLFLALLRQREGIALAVLDRLGLRRGADRLGRLLLVTLEAARRRADAHPLPTLRTWLDSWAGIGHVAVGMHRQGYDLQLTQYDERGWRATFYATGMEHSPTSATGTEW